jgi:hypothetical protein
MRAKQSTSQLTQSSLAQTILPSAPTGRGRKSRSAEPPAPVVETPPPPSAVPAPLQAPMEFAGAPTTPEPAAPVWSPPSPPAQTTAPAWSPPAPAAAPDWRMSTSRFGNAPAAFGNAPANPQFGSAPATEYPVNYPAAPGFPPQPHYADSPAADYPPSATAGQWAPQHAAQHHGGTQTAPPGYGPPPFGAPGYGGYPVGATPGRSTASRVLIALAITVVGIIGIGIIAAVAIPVFLSQRDKPVPVTLVLPQTLEGSTKLDSPALEQVQSTVESTVFPDRTVFSDPQAAFWGNGAPTFGVVAAKLVHRPTQSQAADYWNGVTRGATQDQVTLTNVPPGALGGTTECGMATGEDIPFLMCFSLDNSAAVYVIVYTSDMVQGTLMAEKLRGDIETH